MVHRSSEQRIRAELDRFDLSKREKEVCVLVIQGLSNREAAEKLRITEQTVKDHLYSVYRKMGISRRGALAAQVLRL